MWETIPGVVRNNGTDTFRIEVNVNGPVSNVTMVVYDNFLTQSGQANITFRDDGLNGDRIAGDGIYTSEPIRFNTNSDADLPSNYWWDTNSPAGVMPYFPGNLAIGETNGTVSDFLIRPEIGILDQSIPLVPTVQLSTNVFIAPHLINVMTTNLYTQKFLREYPWDAAAVPQVIYSVLPDAFDFFVYFSSYRVEYVPYDTSYNGVAGAHYSIQINFTGTGQSKIDNSAACGSAGRLLGVNALDTYDRGMSADICTHEIMHQWASYLSAFPFSDGQHYVGNCSIGSPLGGGGPWTNNGDGTFTVTCESLTHLDDLDKYLMGLIATNLVGAVRVYSPTSSVSCGGIISNLISTTTIQDIVNTYGLRTPGPATARRNFSIGFVVDSNQRLLTPVEMTYYEIFARHYTAPLPTNQPDPALSYTWTSINHFFGEGTTWSSDVLSLIEPRIQSIQRLPGQSRIIAQGIGGWNYTLQGSTNLQSWSSITNLTAGTNGVIVATDTSPDSAYMHFYRLTRP